MEGFMALHLRCACGRTVSLPYKREWEGLLRDQLLPRFKCSACGQRPNDMRRGWAVDTTP